jgi:hypothetical protein
MNRLGLRVFAAATLLAIHSVAFAGITYHFQSVSSGMSDSTIAGRAAADGQNFRLDVSTGDGKLIKDHSVIVSHDGGKTIRVADLAAKTYYDLDAQQLLQGAASLFNGGGLVKMSTENQKVSVRDEGNGGTIEGFPTTKTAVDISYDLILDAGGQKISSHLTTTSESWATDQIGAEYTNFLLSKGMKSGIEAIDKLIDAPASAHISGFVLKQIATVTMSQNGSDMTSTTTSTVSGIVKENVPASKFQLPAGLTKTDNPIAAMMKQIGMQ